MSELELQEEEREVLLSIYDGDDSFKNLTSNTFQYKFGENDSHKSFLLEIKWGEEYPNVGPQVNMDLFYNKHLSSSLKEKIVRLIETESQQYLGMSMTYSLFEFIKEKFDELIEDQAEILADNNDISKLTIEEEEDNDNIDNQEVMKKAPKKEHLTKAQKRRQWNKLDMHGEKPRGWNWVDIVKHLSQTGSKESAPAPTS